MTEAEAMTKYGKLLYEALGAAGPHKIRALKQVKAMNVYIRKHFPEGRLVKQPDQCVSSWIEEYED